MSTRRVVQLTNGRLAAGGDGTAGGRRKVGAGARTNQERSRPRSAYSGGFYRAPPTESRAITYDESGVVTYTESPRTTTDDDSNGRGSNDGTDVISVRSGLVDRTRTEIVSPTSGLRWRCGTSVASRKRRPSNSNEYAAAMRGPP